MDNRNDKKQKGPRPEEREAFLKRQPASKAPSTVASNSYNVCLGPTDNGFATLFWSAQAIGSDDWVAVYASPPSGGYSGYLDWEHADDGSSYVTNVGIAGGQVAIYWAWNSTTSEYVNVAQTPAFPSMVCSS